MKKGKTTMRFNRLANASKVAAFLAAAVIGGGCMDAAELFMPDVSAATKVSIACPAERVFDGKTLPLVDASIFDGAPAFKMQLEGDYGDYRPKVNETGYNPDADYDQWPLGKPANPNGQPYTLECNYGANREMAISDRASLKHLFASIPKDTKICRFSTAKAGSFKMECER